MVTRVMSVREFGRWSKGLRKNMEIAGVDAETILAKSLRRRIRRRGVGRLKQIDVKAFKKNVIVQYPSVEIARIARFVDRGKFPKFPIPAQLMDASRSGRPTAGRKSREVLGTLDNPVFVQPRPSSAKGFLTKSFDGLKKEATTVLKRETLKALKKLS